MHVYSNNPPSPSPSPQPILHAIALLRRHEPIFPCYLCPVLYQTRAIVFRTVKYGEASLIVDMYTEQKGHQTFIVHSVRKAKANTPQSYLQLMSLIDMVAYHRDQRKIHNIKEIRLDHSYLSIPFDMRKSAVITCVAEITSRCLTTSYAQPELFQFLHSALTEYDRPDHYDRDFLIRYLVSLTQFLGFAIELPQDGTSDKYLDLLAGNLVVIRPSHDYVMSAEEIASLQLIMTAGSNVKENIPLETRRRIIDQLVIYYQLHVETLREVSSIKILRELIS